MSEPTEEMILAGMAIVPVEPTHGMCLAGNALLPSSHNSDAVWKAMLAAAKEQGNE